MKKRPGELLLLTHSKGDETEAEDLKMRDLKFPPLWDLKMGSEDLKMRDLKFPPLCPLQFF